MKKETPVIISNLEKLKIKLEESHALVGMCPSFKINPMTLDIPLHTIQYSQERLVGCFTTFQAKKIAALCGIGFLYFDMAFLNSIGLVNTTPKFSTQEEAEIKAKEYVQSLEKDWFSRQPQLQKYKDQIILTGDLLDNSICKEMAEKLATHCESKKNIKLATILKFQSEKFVANHFKEILSRQELKSLYNNESVKALLQSYMSKYIYFEFSVFAYFATKGWNVFMYPQVDARLRKAIVMTLAFFKSSHIQQVVSISFEKNKDKEMKKEEKYDSLIIEKPAPKKLSEEDMQLLTIKLIISSDFSQDVKASLIKIHFSPPVHSQPIIVPVPSAAPISYWSSSATTFFNTAAIVATGTAIIGIVHSLGRSMSPK